MLLGKQLCGRLRLGDNIKIKQREIGCEDVK